MVGNPVESGGKLRAGVQPDVLGGDDEHLPGLRRNVVCRLPDDAALHEGGIASLRRFDLVRRHTLFYHAIANVEFPGTPAMLAVDRPGAPRKPRDAFGAVHSETRQAL